MPILLFISTLFIAFLIYGFIGWAYESCIWAICEKKKFINRGFLLGPCCPIYGVVSILDWYFLNRLQNPLVIFFVSLIVCCIVEYFISWGLEKIFHARWWDYSNYPFNLNGRISLYSAFLFGAAGLLLVKIVHPLVMSLVSLIPSPVRYIIAITLAIVFLTDLIISLIALNNFNRKILSIYKSLNNKLNEPFEYLNDKKEYLMKNIVVQKGKGVLLKAENINEKLKEVELHVLKAFPDFKSILYSSVVDPIKKKLDDNLGKNICKYQNSIKDTDFTEKTQISEDVKE